jgi:UDPglucose--hexose-1-phosphate uridylyltransferase
MADFRFIKHPVSKRWVISAPRRAKRPDVGKGVQLCPFCAGQEDREKEIYRVGGKAGDSDWHMRVLKNHFPFTDIHELVIHSPDHHKNFDELPFSQVELILQTYRERYNANKDKGQVYIFHNRGMAAGESLPHPHTQIAVIPREVQMEIAPLERRGVLQYALTKSKKDWEEFIRTDHFVIFCPETSEWPDEVWVAPMQNDRGFGALHDVEISDLAFCLSRVIQILDLRHGHEFPFNFYIAPGKQWYLRIIPRSKTLGGFEVGTGIGVNTQDPRETFQFIQEHFWEPDLEKIRTEHQAEYWRNV